MASFDEGGGQGSLLAGKLRIIRLIGEGGMGAVYEVEHAFTKHRRALKLLRPELSLSPEVVSRFLREASAAGRIDNPHIVETFDAGMLDTGEPYIVMELLEGRSLADVLEQRGRLDFTMALEIVGQACEAIQAAHDAGIVHRDLKPDNLFLLARERTFVKILDFGISKFDSSRVLDSNVTHDGATLGTPYYMSPEQIRGAAHVDGRTDVYALGVVLYECLTGTKPFMAETVAAIAILIHEGKYEPLCCARPDAPPGLEAVLARALHVDRERRYPSPAAFAEALAAVDFSRIVLESAETMVLPPTDAQGTPSDVMSGRRSTLVSEQVVPAVTDPARVPSSIGTVALPGIDAGLVSEPCPERRRLPRRAGLAAALLLSALAALVLKNRASSDEGGAHPPAESPPIPASERTEIERSTPTPTVTPIVSALVPVPIGSPSMSASAQARLHSNKPPPKFGAPQRSGTAGEPSRARQHGLAEDNPFQ